MASSYTTTYGRLEPRARRTPAPGTYARRATEIVLHLILLTIGVVYLFPFIWTLGSALKTPGEFFTQGINPFPAGAWQWQNYQIAWERAQFSRYFFNTLVIAVSNGVLVCLLASMAAYALARLPVPGKKLFVAFVAILFMLPKGFAILPTFQIIQAMGLLNTLAAIIIVLTAGGMLFNTFLLFGYMQNIPRELEESAIIDGASVPQRFFFIILPLCRPMLATVFLLAFLAGWNEFFLSLVFTLANPNLRTLAVGMYAFVGQNSRDWTLICAGATISLVPIIALFVILQRQFVDAFAGAIKN